MDPSSAGDLAGLGPVRPPGLGRRARRGWAGARRG